MTIELNNIRYTISTINQNSSGRGRIARFLGSGWYTDEQIIEVAKQFPGELTITEEPIVVAVEVAQPTTSEKTIATLDAEIQKLETAMEKIGQQQSTTTYNLNPAADMGGIRSRSARQRNQIYNRLDKLNADYMKKHSRLGEIKAMKTVYVKACKHAADLPAIIESGKFPSGNLLTKENMKDAKDLLKRALQDIGAIEHKVAMWRLHEKAS